MAISILAACPLLNARGEKPPEIIAGREGLVAFWDFREDAGKARISLEGNQLSLLERDGDIERVDTGVFGPHSARIRHGQWFMIERKDIGPLNIHGKDAQVSVIAWIKRETTPAWQTIAGVWDETRSKRQYCLFLNASRSTDSGEMQRYRVSDRIHGHVSAVGGPTPGNKVCITYSSGATDIPLNEWHCIAMTYDGTASRVYIDGRLGCMGAV